MKILRLLIFTSYFMPFIFLAYGCEGDNTISFYSKKEFDNWNLKREKKQPELPSYVDSLSNIYKEGGDVAFYDSIVKLNSDSTGRLGKETTQTESHVSSNESKIDYGTEILTFLISPADDSLSGTGIMLMYSNLTGKILIAISFLGSLVAMVFGFLRKQRLKTELVIQSIAIISLVSFITISIFFVKADLLWGFWLCFLLSLAQIAWQIGRLKKV